MNKLSFLSCLILLISIKSMGQQRTGDSLLYNIFPVVDGLVAYQKIIESPGKTKSDIYKAIKSWAASTFTSQKDALQSDDLDAGLIIYKFNFPSSCERTVDGDIETINTTYWQNLKVYIKDERLKIVVDNLKVNIGESSFFVSTYEKDNKEITEKAIIDYKKTTKVSAKMEAKMRDNASRYDRAVMGNFLTADKEIKDMIAGIEKIIKSGKESDF